ncbi:MAG: substrate-binding domain-containing protein, partial [Planctomycetes bacterium]|nr:substrate-binding domain-containing protein [Planctomycetota bacterium]
DQRALKNPIENAIDYGVAVVTVNSGVDSEKVRAHAGTNNYNAGAAAAHELARLIDKKGTVIDIGIDASSETGRERENGFRETMERDYPDVTVLPTQHSLGDVSRAMNITADQLTGNPEVVGIFCAQDNGGTGAAQALKQRGIKDRIKLVAFDSSPDEFQLFLEGYLDSLVVQDPFAQGYQGVYAIDAIINGQELPQRFFETPAKVITHDNLSDPEIYDIQSSNPTIKAMMEKRGITRN